MEGKRWTVKDKVSVHEPHHRSCIGGRMTERLPTMSEEFSGRGDWADSTTELLRAPQRPESQSTAIEGLEIE